MTTTATTTKPRGGRPMGAGGKRLAEAFEAVSTLPAHVEARRRGLAACADGEAPADRLAEAIESDPALAITVMRAAARNGSANGSGNGAVGGPGAVAAAVEALGPRGVESALVPLATYDLHANSSPQSLRYERFRRHGLAVRDAGDRVGALAGIADRDELALAALLHDLGRLVLAEMYGDDYDIDARPGPPDERARLERRELGIDHAIVGAVLIRRWGLPAPIAAAVERHHAPDATGIAGAVRVADLLVHDSAGEEFPREALRASAARLGIDAAQVRALSYEFPHLGRPRQRRAEPCPLSSREVDALRGLADGKVYKQIAQELSVSVSTVRTHLHNVYRKIGAVDRAQAVLIARERGWI